ncbi:uncharacterized protein BO97DRAFT_50632 [Aspergillus homomorphus CBS 101889]|uniref:Uncharacterized protein n=1 Tax=Aspergillus homomorphus (strain CBS 101889) TaxID=1450537 RepID=A0A395HYL1_ASPHC|nr:hypothetical protein BO97DRAFT_50632 [Aspergillus homomorphus CBS 101889]RAL13021.1 hypothetical protein BO97DRAFT_50632 [Aspergillus homomorphus CBS 101889]
MHTFFQPVKFRLELFARQFPPFHFQTALCSSSLLSSSQTPLSPPLRPPSLPIPSPCSCSLLLRHHSNHCLIIVSTIIPEKSSPWRNFQNCCGAPHPLPRCLILDRLKLPPSSAFSALPLASGLPSWLVRPHNLSHLLFPDPSSSLSTTT